MKTGKRNKWIALLMLVSELMIAGFSAYWLASQYTREKESLEKELYAYYKESYNVAIDSLLITHLIEPALGEGDEVYGWRRRAGNIESSDSLTLYAAIMKADSTKGQNKGLVRIEINGEHDTADGDGRYSYIQSRDSVLLRSMRLIIEKTSDSTINTESVISRIGRGPDSLVFIEDYESRLDKNEMNLSLDWLEAGSQAKLHRAIILEDWTGKIQPVIIRYPVFYLLGRIYPQILFTVILVLISSLAFLLAYHGIKEQARLNDMRNNFISNISHELKTPVSTVKVAIEALKKYDASQGEEGSRDEYLEMAGKEIQRLELLISKVLDHSIIEEDESILTFRKVDLAALVEEAIRSLRPRMEASGAMVNYNHPEKLIVRCDPVYFQGVIINLFDNSLKYGNGNPEIRVDLYAAGAYAVLKVSDKGPGIPEEYLSRVFDKFFRVPDRDRHNVKGYGLGLSFAHLVVRMHAGSIGVRNNDRGCTFTIKIPLEKK